jgi:hypothetical protein
MAKRTTRKRLVLLERAEEFRREECPSAPDCTEGDEYVVEVLNSIERERTFTPFPLVPIELGDPLLYCDSCCRCGCLRMPQGLEGGFCLYCGHSYQIGDPEFRKTENEHVAHCMPYQEYAQRGSRTLPARCGAPAPCASKEELDALHEALGRLDRVVSAVDYYNFVEKWALEGKAGDRSRQHALKLLSECVKKG